MTMAGPLSLLLGLVLGWLAFFSLAGAEPPAASVGPTRQPLSQVMAALQASHAEQCAEAQATPASAASAQPAGQLSARAMLACACLPRALASAAKGLPAAQRARGLTALEAMALASEAHARCWPQAFRTQVQETCVVDATEVADPSARTDYCACLSKGLAAMPDDEIWRMKAEREQRQSTRPAGHGLTASERLEKQCRRPGAP